MIAMKKLKFDMKLAASIILGKCPDGVRQIVSEAAQLYNDGNALQQQLIETQAEIIRLKNENAFLTDQINEWKGYDQ